MTKKQGKKKLKKKIKSQCSTQIEKLCYQVKIILSIKKDHLLIPISINHNTSALFLGWLPWKHQYQAVLCVLFCASGYSWGEVSCKLSQPNTKPPVEKNKCWLSWIRVIKKKINEVNTNGLKIKLCSSVELELIKKSVVHTNSLMIKLYLI